jgi:hypothetical protein
MQDRRRVFSGDYAIVKFMLSRVNRWPFDLFASGHGLCKALSNAPTLNYPSVEVRVGRELGGANWGPRWDRLHVALGLGNAVIGRSAPTEAAWAGGRQRHVVHPDARPHALIEPGHESGISPMRATSHVQFERPRLARCPRDASQQA